MSKRSPLTFNSEKKSSSASATQSVEEQATPKTSVKGKGRQGRQFIAAHVVPEAAKQFKLEAPTYFAEAFLCVENVLC